MWGGKRVQLCTYAYLHTPNTQSNKPDHKYMQLIYWKIVYHVMYTLFSKIILI